MKGNILRSEIDGCIQMRNFVAGYPEVKIALNEDFFVGKSDVVSRGKLFSSSFKKVYFKKCVTLWLVLKPGKLLRADQCIIDSAVGMFIIFSAIS